MIARPILKSLALCAGLFVFGNIDAAESVVDDCLPKAIDITAKVNIVYDGDSFLVGDQYVRLIGVHVPSSSQHLEPPEPLGKAVSQVVGELIKRSNGELKIEYDQLKSEKGKVMVHAYLADGRNLAKALLENGFAVVNTQLPNTKHAQCYREAEKKAREAKKGLWQFIDKGVPVIESKDLTAERKGFQIVRGKITLSQQGSEFYLMNMDTLGIRISKKDMALFNEKDLASLMGKTIEVRDHLTYYKGNMFAMIEHPGQIDVLADKFYESLNKKLPTKK